MAGLTCLRAADKDTSPPDFAKTGYAFIQKHCTECHGEKKSEGEIALHNFKDEASVLKGRKLWIRAMKMVASGEMPPVKQPRPAPAELDTFTHTISAIFEKADRNAKPDPGRVAMRRLNRVEYNNTVRDLLNIDFNAAEDFPSDEVGHGFDNMSDVQWISDVLMERYIAASESIAMRAIAVSAPQPVTRYQAGKFLEPAGPTVPDKKYRPISGENPADPIMSGPLHTPHKVPNDGEYNFKTHVYAEVPAGQTVKVALLVCGPNVPKPATDKEAKELFGAAVQNLRPFQIVKIGEVKSRAEKGADVIQIRLPANSGLERIAVAIVKPTDGKPVPKVFVEWLALDGPLDTRPYFQRKNMTYSPETPKEKKSREVLMRVASRAYRRPATEPEILRLLKIVEEAEKRDEKWEAGILYAIEAILISPKFLFRSEILPVPSGTATAVKDVYPVSEYELASRLSYFLWSSMPDDELFALAEKKQLSANLDAQVRRMLKDPKSRALIDNFAMQWLQLRRLATIAPDAKAFPKYNWKLKAAILEETSLFVDAIIREDRSILDLIDSNFTFLNETLAEHYNITDTNGTQGGQKPSKPGGKPIKGKEFRRVELTDGQRGGLLTQASILTVTSNPTRTSPVKRGKWVLEQLLGTPPPPAPPNIPELENSGQLTGTLRQRMEQHRANPSCANCHARMDPIGFAFENFDAVGAYRSKDGKNPIDASGTLPSGQSFKGYVELKGILKDKKDQFSLCFTEKLLTYALGRGLEMYDKRSVDRITEALKKDNYKFSTLAIEICKSEPFRLRRGKEEEK